MVSEQRSLDWLDRIALLAGLTGPQRVELLSRSILQTYAEGAYLFREGERGDLLFVLELGQVRATRTTATGREVVLASIEGPAVFGELALIDGKPRSASLIATRTTRVLMIPRSVFLDLVDRHPSVRDGLLRTLAGLVRAGNDRHVDTVGLDAAGRAAKWIVSRTERNNEFSTPVVVLGRTQGELAEELGITRVRLNQVLKSFEAAGLIEVAATQLVVKDEASLVSLFR